MCFNVFSLGNMAVPVAVDFCMHMHIFAALSVGHILA